MTRSEIGVAMDGYIAAVRIERRRDLSLAWHTARLVRARPRMPSLEKLLGPIEDAPQVDPEEQLAELERVEAEIAAEERRAQARADAYRQAPAGAVATDG